MAELGLPRGSVALREYTPRWAELFESARVEIERAVGDGALAIEHVGSTSVAGLAAKPIIDIAVAVESFEEALALVAPLEAIGFIHRGEYGIPRRRYFMRGEPRTHHIHMFEITSDEWRCHLLFRDRLRSEPALAREYERLKRSLAAAHQRDRAAYTEGKSEFIRSVIRD